MARKTNGNGDLTGLAMSIFGRVPCYKFSKGGRVQRTKEFLLDGTPVTCGQTREAKKGNSRGKTLLVKINVLDSSTGKMAWVKLADLRGDL